MNATVNAFPPLHALNSSRGWFIALIALLHVGFFYALVNGGTFYFTPLPDAGPITPVPLKPIIEPKPVVPPEPTDIRAGTVDPQPMPNEIDYREKREEKAPDAGPRVDPKPQQVVDRPGAGPYIVQPALDARYPFTEPEYPVSEIRQEHEGVVLLALEILPNGRVGNVRIEKSSGFVKLDDAAAREAKRWRMQPGTSDGTATTMWRVVPIKFQLKR